MLPDNGDEPFVCPLCDALPCVCDQTVSEPQDASSEAVGDDTTQDDIGDMVNKCRRTQLQPVSCTRARSDVVTVAKKVRNRDDSEADEATGTTETTAKTWS